MTRRMRMVAELVHDNPGERVGESGHTLGRYLAEFGGLVGRIEDPYGVERTVNLAPFDGADPARYLAITFVEEMPGRPLPAVGDGEIVLAEYSLPSSRPPWLPPVREA